MRKKGVEHATTRNKINIADKCSMLTSKKCLVCSKKIDGKKNNESSKCARVLSHRLKRNYSVGVKLFLDATMSLKSLKSQGLMTCVMVIVILV